MDSTQNEDQEASLNALVFSGSHVLPFILHTAIELDLFNIIAKFGPEAYVSASEIASHLPTTNPDAPSLLDRMLHFFVTYSLLSYSPQMLEDGRIVNTYALTPTCKFYTGKVEDGNLSFISRLHFHKATIESWLNVKDVILEGGNVFKKVNGMNFFEYMNKDEDFNNIFKKAMTGHSIVLMNEILEVYKGFEGVETLVDVGGGIGGVLNMIISKYPLIKGINFDLPHVVQSAPFYHGIEHISGNMFELVPKGDAIMLKDICHNWPDIDMIKMLKSIYKALPDNGKLIIIDALMPENPDSSNSSKYIARLDITMFTQLPSGKERSANQFEALIKAAGFANFKVVCVAIKAVMECYK
ncbi:O-methyltransferase family protein [Euphorbia peplus]|nr:O-methyltransferase family protein [Euphorbia peplus]